MAASQVECHPSPGPVHNCIPMLSSSWGESEGEKAEDEDDDCCTSGFVSENEQDSHTNVSPKVSFRNHQSSITSEGSSISDNENLFKRIEPCPSDLTHRPPDMKGSLRFFSPPAARRCMSRRDSGGSLPSTPYRSRKAITSPLMSKKRFSSDTSTEESPRHSISSSGRERMDSTSSESSSFSARGPNGFSRRAIGSKVKIASRRPTMRAIQSSDEGQTSNTFLKRNSLRPESVSSPDYMGQESLNGPTSPNHRRRPEDDESQRYSRIQVLEVVFVLPKRNTVLLNCPGNKTVGQIKDMLWNEMSESGIMETYPELMNHDDYSLKYKKFGMDYELYDQEQLFQTLSIVSYWQTKRKAQPELRVELKKTDSEKAREFQELINSLVGMDMEQLISSSNNDEADITRRKLVSARHAAVSSRDSELYAMEPALTHSEVPEPVRKMCAMWIEINVQFEDQKDLRQVILFQVSETPLDLLQFLFNPDSGKRSLLGIPDSADRSLYTLKVCGQDSYLYRTHTFLKYTYIRRCLLKKAPIHLAVVKKPDVKEDLVQNHGEPDFIDDCCNLTGSHQQLSALTKMHSEVFTMSLWDIQTPYRVKVVGVDGIKDKGNCSCLYVEAGIYHGGNLLCPAKGLSVQAPTDEHLLINQMFNFDIAVCNLPKAARMHIAVYANKASKISRRGSQYLMGSQKSTNTLSTPGSPSSATSPGTKRKLFGLFPSPRTLRRQSEDVIISDPVPTDTDQLTMDGQDVDMDTKPDNVEPLYWVNVQLLDHRAVLRTGYHQIALWHVDVKSDNERDTSKFSPNSCTSEHPDRTQTATCFMIMDTYAHRVACPTAGLGQLQKDPSNSDLKGDSAEEVRSPSKKFLRQSLDDAISCSDPLKPLTKEDKDLLWNCRDICKKRPEALPRFLLSLNWADKGHVLEMHRLLRSWEKPTIEVALQLLDYHFADESVRCLAVSRLEKLEKDELLTFLLQLVQTLKFEPYHDSALAYFLLERALQSKRIGHNFYWFLRAEMDAPEYRERFGLLLEAYLRGCGKQMLGMIHRQQEVNQFLKMAAAQVKDEKLEARAGALQKLIESSDVMKGELRPVYDSSVTIGDLVVKKCKCMDSKKVPLWLEFANKDPTTVIPAPVKVIFKQGDDLRQDMLTLQMIKLMDKLWQDNGLDLMMLPYGCMSTGNEVGMIEVVLEAETVASIQRKRGGDIISNARASFADETLSNWLKEKQSSHAEHVQAVRRFAASCAGYCVATYVLGIGDRHNDNIMITKSGNLFHIDFGHFLGNTKKFLKGLVNRERAPFVLTPDFVHIMGKKDSANFRHFLEDACKAYNIIRKHAHLFINLFSMMKCTGIPELTCIEDIDYLRNVLLLDKTDEEAEQHFTKQVVRCLELSWTVRCNFVAHNVKHR
ncbi:phosphatidylinositol 4,5-bisphosphate 3-kinase catalytic subunit gamma isoform-like isoform X2 [Sycon ciliatum]